MGLPIKLSRRPTGHSTLRDSRMATRPLMSLATRVLLTPVLPSLLDQRQLSAHSLRESPSTKTVQDRILFQTSPSPLTPLNTSSSQSTTPFKSLNSDRLSASSESRPSREPQPTSTRTTTRLPSTPKRPRNSFNERSDDLRMDH